MTYEVYRYIFVAGAALSVLMLITAAVLFFVLKIPRVIGDLTGATARKAIQEIRNQNEASGRKTYKSSAVNRERGKLTDRITPSGKLHNRSFHDAGGAMATSKISTQKLGEEAMRAAEQSAGAPFGGEETTLLSPQNDGAGETTVLQENYQGAGETTVLAQAPEGGFRIEFEITFIHTDEVIG